MVSSGYRERLYKIDKRKMPGISFGPPHTRAHVYTNTCIHMHLSTTAHKINKKISGFFKTTIFCTVKHIYHCASGTWDKFTNGACFFLVLASDTVSSMKLMKYRKINPLAQLLFLELP